MTYIIDDTNADQFADLHAELVGGTFGLIPRDYSQVPYESIPGTKPFSADFPLIPKAEWAGRIAAMKGRFPRQLHTDLVDPKWDNQNGLSYCWTFSLNQALKGARRREGQPHVETAAVSLGGDVNWRNAGNYCGSAIKYAAAHGFCDATFPDSQWSRSPSKWKTGWENEALNHRVLEWWELGAVDMQAEVVTALLNGFGVYTGLNWASHALWFDELQWDGGKLLTHTPNTWGVNMDWLLTGKKQIPDEAYVCRVTTWANG